MVIRWHIHLQPGEFNKRFCKLFHVGYTSLNLEQIIVLLLQGLCRSTDIYSWGGRGPPIPHLKEYGRFLPHAALSTTPRLLLEVVAHVFRISRWRKSLGKLPVLALSRSVKSFGLLGDNHAHSPLFSIALSRFRSEVKREDDCVLDVTSAQELLRQTKAIENKASTRTKRSTPSTRLEAILPHLNDFAAVIAVCGGADPKTTGLIWGSLKVIWTVKLALLLGLKVADIVPS